MYKKRFFTLAKCINSYSYAYPGNRGSSNMISEIARRALPNDKKNIAVNDFMTSLDSYNIVSELIKFLEINKLIEIFQNKLKDGGDNGLLKLMKQEGFFENYKTLSGHAELIVSQTIDTK